MTPSTAYRSVTSSAGTPCRASQSRSRMVVAELETRRKDEAPVRVTVRSASYVPRSLRNGVYTHCPTRTSTSAAHTHCSPSSAEGPETTYFEKEVWSKPATSVRQAACSAADHGSQDGLPHEYSRTGPTTLGRSQPIRVPKSARARPSRECRGEVRWGRPDSSSRFGHGSA